MAIQFMYAELFNGVSERMRCDPQSRIISDGILFLITNENNTSNYPELTFEIVDQESLDTYSEQLKGLL